MEIIQLSSLAKTFPSKIYGNEISSAEIAKGQSFSFQIALRGENCEYKFVIDSPISEYINVSRVGYVPMTMPTYDSCKDEDYLTKEKGMCPDPLIPIFDNVISVGTEYTSLWINVNLPADIEAQDYIIKVMFYDGAENVGATELVLTVHSTPLPKQKLLFTQWFHTDCIADVHGVPVYSEEHWSLIESYVSLAAKHGMNMILVPVLTPPLDTEVGGERTTVQLAKIVKENGEYTFEFSKLKRFIDICLKCGIEFFEINHMFTQWGAKNAPKVVATVNGVEEKIFGWETDATSKDYVEFLSKLIPSVIKVFDECGVEKSRLYFHVSDEPSFEHLDAYKSAKGAIADLVEGCNQVDALSHYEFYNEGLVKTPVVATNAIEPFLEANVPNLWCYYCCAQHEKVANRFMAMPSYRNRIIGVQMYKCSIVGFLHWGYNFYNLQYSKGKINPYEVTDAGGAFPSGDSFSVYPYENTAIPSLRQKVFKNALEDIQLLSALEEKIGKQSVIELIDKIAGEEITFKSYPKNEEFFTQLYSEIFKILNA